SGQAATNAEDTVSYNAPYTISFTAEEHQAVELVLQAANLSDPRSGGLIRSMKFGLEEHVSHERNISLFMQFIIAMLLVFQAIYLLFIYIVDRNKPWLYVSLMLLSIAAAIFSSSEDKLFSLFFPLDYDSSFTLLNLSLILLT